MREGEKVEVEEMRDKQVQNHRGRDAQGLWKGAVLPGDGMGRGGGDVRAEYVGSWDFEYSSHH